MTMYSLYLFVRNGTCIFYKEWRQDKQSGMPKVEELKRMFEMMAGIASKECLQLVRYFNTSSYQMNYIDIPAGMKIVR
ncbi:unnamed protein product [Heligmosomoides polygyrus]|uniref:Trafficking protein particle complex subunit n=1 Tax=Heligmosomoides polygyrus TaxID=6339 RepID=A0A183FP43_HELPZ|nr:unnamed protein product [Heligmosomoides polygyrus]